MTAIIDKDMTWCPRLQCQRTDMGCLHCTWSAKLGEVWACWFEENEQRVSDVYDEGFDNGVKATLQQLDGLLMRTDSAVEIQEWVDRQWEEYES